MMARSLRSKKQPSTSENAAPLLPASGAWAMDMVVAWVLILEGPNPCVACHIPLARVRKVLLGVGSVRDNLQGA